MQNWTLSQWLAFIEHQHGQAIDMGLERMQQMAERLKLLKPNALTIIVAGTNGKGSSTSTLSAIYTQAGYRTGWYSSPHLMRYNERVCINNQPVADHLLIQAFQVIYDHLAGLTLSFFEWGTLAAFWIFKQQDCQVQILEVGLGGRLDAVNVIDADAALITPIDIDHQALLGSDIERIALEKAGVLRSQQIAVCSDPKARASLLAYAQQLNLAVALVGREFHYQRLTPSEWQWTTAEVALTLPQPKLLGEFQLSNISGVVMLVHLLQARLPVTHEQLALGLQSINLVGRLDYRKLGQANWLFDVAHNPQSIGALVAYGETLPSEQPISLVFSALSDKDIAPMVKQLSAIVDSWYVAVLSSHRAASRAQLEQALSSLPAEKVFWCHSIESACELAQQQPKNVLRLVTGSFLTVEQGLNWWQQQVGYESQLE